MANERLCRSRASTPGIPEPSGALAVPRAVAIAPWAAPWGASGKRPPGFAVPGPENPEMRWLRRPFASNAVHLLHLPAPGHRSPRHERRDRYRVPVRARGGGPHRLRRVVTARFDLGRHAPDG